MNEIVDVVVAPLQLRFFPLALAATVAVLLAGAALGFSVLVRRQAYMGQGVGQAMIAGVAVGAVAGVHPTLSAFAGAITAAGLTTALTKVRGVTADTAIATVATVAMAIGVTIISADRSRSVNLTNVLFGNVLGVTAGEVVGLVAVAVAAWGFTITTGRRSALAATAPAVAAAHGVAVDRVDLARSVALSVTIAASVQVVGVSLAVAALVLPTAAAVRWARTLSRIHIAAAGFATVTGVVGIYVSYWVDVASGPAVVLTGAVLYGLTIALTAGSRSSY